MKRLLLMLIVVGLILSSVPVYALGANEAETVTEGSLLATPRLSIKSIKVTGDEFIVLTNMTSDPLELTNFKLQYFNNYVAIEATSSKLIDLSETVLPAGGSFMVITEPAFVCEGMVVSSESLGFTDKKGLVQVVELAQDVDGQAVSYSVEDYVSWTDDEEAAANDSLQLVPDDKTHFLWRQTEETDVNGETVGLAPSVWSWLEAETSTDSICDISLVDVTEPEEPSDRPPLTIAPVTSPPATIVSLPTSSEEDSDAPVFPARNVGLTSPQLSELLPNPGKPQTDANDEYIELYNPNSEPFELSGFVLEVGTRSKRRFTFPKGQLMKPESFMAFASRDTNLALSNTGSQVWLKDPFGNVLSEAKPYTGAKDNQAWALAEGEWYFTTTPTPSAANVITAGGASGRDGSVASAVSATDIQPVTDSGTAGAVSVAPDDEVVADMPLHPFILAAITSLALGYALYEYRHDISNRIYQFRAHRTARRANRKSLKGRRDD